MSRHLAVIVVLSLCCADISATTRSVSMSCWDATVDMVNKAKYNGPTCISPGKNVIPRATDCSDLIQMGYNESGLYTIWPMSRINGDKALEVYCDMQTTGGGWTLIQRRGDFQRAKDYFNKDWKSYKEGFGDVEKDFWLGNDNIFALSNQKLYSVRFDLADLEYNFRYAQYDTFWIDDENHQYTLHIADYSGDAGDAMTKEHNYKKFSTKDKDNDDDEKGHCAQTFQGGWWYSDCFFANLNGIVPDEKYNHEAGFWDTWKFEPMESTEIKIRPKKFRPSHISLNSPM